MHSVNTEYLSLYHFCVINTIIFKNLYTKSTNMNRIKAFQQSEKLLPLPASANPIKSSRISSSGRSKRRRLIALFLTFLAILFFIGHDKNRRNFLNPKFIKDGVYKVPLPNVSKEDVNQKIANLMINNAQGEGAGTAGLGSTDLNGVSEDHPFIPTAALKNLASKLHIPIPSFGGGQKEGFLAEENSISSSSITPPSHSDRILLLLNAVKKKGFLVPSEIKDRVLQLQPETASAFSHALSLLKGDSIITNSDLDMEDDAKLYLEAHDTWLAKQRKQSPLIVFSKSYCPFSRKAKELLTRIGAQFEVFEVDLRQDAHELQEVLRDISGHKTFPAIFLGDSLIGGSDDLARLQSTGMLHGILEAAGVNFNPVKNS